MLALISTHLLPSPLLTLIGQPSPCSSIFYNIYWYNYNEHKIHSSVHRSVHFQEFPKCTRFLSLYSTCKLLWNSLLLLEIPRKWTINFTSLETVLPTKSFLENCTLHFSNSVQLGNLVLFGCVHYGHYARDANNHHIWEGIYLHLPTTSLSLERSGASDFMIQQ